MKLLLDQGLPRSAVALLSDMGHMATHVGAVGLCSATDVEILAYAHTNSQVVVTMDADFHTLLATTNANLPSVIRIRTEGFKASQIAQLLNDLVRRCEQEITRGAVLSVRGDHVRLRLLPINKNRQQLSGKV